MKMCQLLRLPEWIDTKVPYVLTAYLLAALSVPADARPVSSFLRVLAFTVLFQAFGYAINDWSDRTTDLMSGKPNAIGALPWPNAIGLLTALGIAGIVILWPLLSIANIGILVAFSYGLAIAYSCRPLRLKERGLAGPIVAALAQRPLPAVIVFVAVGAPLPVVSLFLALTFIIGLRWMLIHQIDDMALDIASGTRTLATRYGCQRMQQTLPFLFRSEQALIVALGIQAATLLPATILIIAVYIAVTALFTWCSGESFTDMLRSPSGAYLVLGDYYLLYWPLGLAIVLAVYGRITPLWLLAISMLLSRHIDQHLRGFATCTKYIMDTRRLNGQ